MTDEISEPLFPDPKPEAGRPDQGQDAPLERQVLVNPGWLPPRQSQDLPITTTEEP